VDRLGALAADRIERGEVGGAVEQLSAGLDPVVHERRLHLAHHRPLGAVLRVAPVVLVLRVSREEVGDADATGEADASIHHQQLPVGPVVQPVEPVPLERAEPDDLNPRVPHPPLE
jgi:hypothetical protein